MMEEIIKKIDDFSKLNKGWNSYKADPPTHWSIVTAKHLVVICNANDIHFDHVAPSVLGGIGITKDNSNEIFIEILNDKNIVVIETKDGEILQLYEFQDDSSKNIAYQAFKKIKQIITMEMANV